MYRKNKVVSLAEYKQHKRQKQWNQLTGQIDKKTKEMRKKRRNKKIIAAAVIIGVAGIVTLIAKKKK